MASQSKNIWKWLFVGLLIAVTFIGTSLYVNWRFTQMQLDFNKKVTANAVSTNAKIIDMNADLEDVIKAINDLEAYFESSQAEQNQRINNNAQDIAALADKVDSLRRRVSYLESDYWELEDRVRALECEIWKPDAEGNCTAPDITHCYDCSRCCDYGCP